MYPLAPVSRMSDFSGIAAGFAVDLLATMVSTLFTSDLLSRLESSEGARCPPVLELVLLHAFLDQIAGCQVFLVIRLRSQGLLNRGHRIGILFSTHCD